MTAQVPRPFPLPRIRQLWFGVPHGHSSHCFTPQPPIFQLGFIWKSKTLRSKSPGGHPGEEMSTPAGTLVTRADAEG